MLKRNKYTASLKSSHFSTPQFLIFALVFAVVGIFIFRTFAANPNLPGDINNDNTVNITDLSILLTNYGTTNTTADLNADNTVNITDLSILLSHYGGSYVPVTSGNKYPAPTLVNPITINVTSANAKTAAYSLDNTKDYNIKITEVITSGVVAIRGGRNVNLIGGEWNISNSSTDVFWDHGGIVIYSGAAGRKVHIEGVYIHGSTLNDGIVWNAAGTIVELQTIRIGPNAAIATGYHPDGIQNQGDIQEVREDKLTIVTALQANFWGDHSSPTNTPMGPIHTSRINMVGSPGKILFWKSANWPSAPPVTIEDSWMYMATPWTTNIGYWVYPSLDGDNNSDLMTYPWIALHMDPNRKARVSADGNYVDFPNSNITGGFNKGMPPGGDFVPASSVGMNYVSP